MSSQPGAPWCSDSHSMHSSASPNQLSHARASLATQVDHLLSLREL